MKTHIKVSEEAVRNWFGNRGYPIDETSRITFRVVDSESRWIFIRDSHDEYEEVIAYSMDSMCCEPYSGWDRKGFSWANKKLEALVDGMEQA